MDKHIPASRIRAVWLDGRLTTAEAAKLVGLSRSNLWRRAREMGLPPRPRGRRPVVPDHVLVELWNAGVRCTDIANHFGCHFLTVSQSARRLKLKPRHVGGGQAAITMPDFMETLLGKAMARRAMTETNLLRNQAMKS